MTRAASGGEKKSLGWKEALIALFLVIVAWAGIDLLSGTSKPVDTSEDAGIQVFFTTPRYPDKTAYHQGGMDEKLTAALDSAQKSVDVAAFEIDLEGVTDALIRAHQRGVTVRVVTDADYAEELGPERLLAAQIHVVFDNGEPFMHNKFVVIDGRQVWTGSWNLTDSCTYRNNNNVVVVNSALLAENYTTEFEEMFVDGKFGAFSPDNTPHPVLTVAGVQVENFLEPEGNARARIIELLKGAKSSIDVMAFVFTDDDIAGAIIARQRAGVPVRIVVETRNVDADGSDVASFQKAGVDIVWDGNPYLMHHKVIVIDNAVVITGSYNFSISAAEQNDENVLILHSAEIAGQYAEEFARVYQQAQSAP